jgi:glycosyltransferase involved in cell wall biosynthesis
LRKFVHEHGLEMTVEFRFDFVDEEEISGLFANSDAALFPYREIDASGVAMTAVAYGLPVLASAVGGFSEQFRDGREARLVPPGNAVSLAGVLREWARAPDALDELAHGMRIHRARIPDWVKIGRRTADVYAAARHVWVGRRSASKTGSSALLPQGSLR